jgi:hypothetical protein
MSEDHKKPDIDWKNIVSIVALVSSLGVGTVGYLRSNDAQVAELEGRVAVLEVRLQAESIQLSEAKIKSIRSEIDLALRPLLEKIESLTRKVERLSP